MNISIVILNWNGKKYLGTFLPKLITSSPEANIYVADNGSSDGSVRFLQQNYPEIKVIPFTENHGFAKGYNLALNQIEADYYILLNTDIEVTDNWIQPVISVMEQDESIAACQPKILSYDNRRHFEYAGAAGGFIDRYGYPFCRGRIFQVIEEDVGQYDDITEIFWASGACLFIKSNLFKKAGGFDNDFFAHMEEIDLCWRLKHLGYKIMYCGQSTVFHIGGGTLDKSAPKKTYLNIRNNNILLYKNLPSKQIIPTFIARFFLDLTASLKFLIDGGVRHFIAVSRAHIGFYFSLRKNHLKRKKIKHIKVSKIYLGNIAFYHFLFGKKTFKQLKSKMFT